MTDDTSGPETVDEERDGKAASPPARGGARHRGGLVGFLFDHEIDEYPSGSGRIFNLGLAVAATIALYYTYYTQTGVTPPILQTFHMSFKYYVWIVIISNLLGAFASLPASKTDKLGRANVVIYGLLIVGLIVAVGVPNVHSKLAFAIVISAMGIVEGAILVATPALVRDFSPQLGRASAMGFWTMGPVAGSLLTSIVANHTLNATSSNWTSQFQISGYSTVGLFVISLFFLKDLSPRLRDQLMVSARDEALLEAKARGISDEELEAATRHPWRQIVRADLILASLGISIFLLVYYAGSGFFTIYYSTTFKNTNGLAFSVQQANGLNTWFWGANIIALIIFGALSDRLRVRKPFMAVGVVVSMVMLIIFLGRASHSNTGYYTLAFIGVLLAAGLAMTFVPWMAAFTESVEARNPALVATGLALWGWLLRLVVGISFIFLPVVISSVNAVVDNQPLLTPTLNGKVVNMDAFLVQHADSVAFATAHQQLLTTLNEPQNQAIVAKLVAETANGGTPSPATLAEAEAKLGVKTLGELAANQTQLTKLVVPYTAQLNYLAAHQSDLLALQNGVDKSPKQWQHWFWVCFGGMVLFIPTMFLTRGRWSPRKAKADAQEHAEAVKEEMAELEVAPA